MMGLGLRTHTYASNEAISSLNTNNNDFFHPKVLNKLDALRTNLLGQEWEPSNAQHNKPKNWGQVTFKCSGKCHVKTKHVLECQRGRETSGSCREGDCWVSLCCHCSLCLSWMQCTWARRIHSTEAKQKAEDRMHFRVGTAYSFKVEDWKAGREEDVGKKLSGEKRKDPMRACERENRTGAWEWKWRKRVWETGNFHGRSESKSCPSYENGGFDLNLKPWYYCTALAHLELELAGKWEQFLMKNSPSPKCLSCILKYFG